MWGILLYKLKNNNAWFTHIHNIYNPYIKTVKKYFLIIIMVYLFLG
jgi:hypothetical protein